MKMPSAIRAALVALTAFAGATLSSASHADEGFVSLTIYKAGWVIGGSGGQRHADLPRPALSRSPPAGSTTASSSAAPRRVLRRPRQQHQPRLRCRRRLWRGAAPGLRVGRGARAIVLTNQKGAVL